MSRRRFSCASCFLTVGLSVLAAPPLAASDEAVEQAATSTANAETRKVVAAKEFDRSGHWRFWFGEGYRKAWTTPVDLPVLDLKTRPGVSPRCGRWGASRRKAWR